MLLAGGMLEATLRAGEEPGSKTNEERPLRSDDAAGGFSGLIRRVGVVGFSHGGELTFAKWVGDSKRCVTEGEDRRIRCWDTKSGQLLWERPVAFFRGTVTILSPKGSYLVNGNGDGLEIVDLQSGESKRRLKIKGGIRPLCISPDEKLLVTSSFGEVVVWDIGSGEKKKQFALFPSEQSIWGAFAPDGKTLSWHRLPEVKRGVETVDVETWEERPLDLPKDEAGCRVNYAADGQSILFSRPTRLVRYEVATKKWDSIPLRLEHGLSGEVSLTKDGRQVCWHTGAKAVVLFDFKTRQFSVVFPRLPCAGVSLSPDGKQLLVATRSRVVEVWALPGMTKIGGEQIPLGAVARIVPVPAKDVILTIHEQEMPGQSRMMSWDGSNWKQRDLRDGLLSEGGLVDVVASPRGNYLACTRPSGTTDIAKVPTGKVVMSIKGGEEQRRVLGFSQDEGHIAIRSADGLELWGIGGDRPARRCSLRGTPFGSGEACYSSRLGCVLVSDARRTSHSEWDWGHQISIWHSGVSDRLQKIPVSDDLLPRSALSGDGWLLAVMEQKFYSGVAVHDTVTGALVRRLVTGYPAPPDVVAFSPSGGYLVGTAWTPGERAESSLYIWNVGTGQRVAKRSMAGQLGAALSFSSNSRELYVGTMEGQIFVWDFQKLVGKDADTAASGMDGLDQAWKHLGGSGREAFDALQKFRGRGEMAVPYLRGRLKPITPPPHAHLAKLVGGLASSDEVVKKQALEELSAVSADLTDVLGEMTEGKETPAVATLNRLFKTPWYQRAPEVLRRVRGSQLLSYLRSGEATKLLQEMSRGWAAGIDTRYTKAILASREEE
jgi:WD40 repeat protein